MIFAGSGATGAIDKLIGILGLRIPSALEDRYRLARHIRPDQRPVVFIGPFEHHSNELPWRESIADVVTIGQDADGHIDLGALEQQLIRHAARPLKIGSFSAASNVTGILSDTAAMASLLHQHGALSLWDCAAAGPYIQLRVTAPLGQPDAYTRRTPTCRRGSRGSRLTARHSPATVRKVHRVFSLMVRTAVKDGRLARNPADEINLPRVVATERRYLTHEQVHALARRWRNLRKSVSTAASTSARIGPTD